MSKAVISIVGRDRPGLVSDITSTANRFELNVEDSRMSVLGGEFAVLMELSGAADALAQFDSAMSEFAGDELSYIYRETDERSGNAQTRPYKVSVVALDHPGIVAAIAEFFSARQINIHDLDTSTSPAPHTGTPIFNVAMTIEVPVDQRSHELKSAFAAFCADEDLDGDLEAAR